MTQGHRDSHHDAVGFAGLQVQELQNILAAASEVHQEAMGIILSAVGEDQPMESGRNALEWMAGIGDKLRELIGICENVKAELNRYGSGF